MEDNKKKVNLRCIVLLMIADFPSRTAPGCGKCIRVVQWVGDRGVSVKLEKVGYFVKDGMTLMGKREGFTLEDLTYFYKKWKEIIQIMKNPPAPPPLPAAKAPQAEETIEEVPF
jgi:hypothetical protein